MPTATKSRSALRRVELALAREPHSPQGEPARRLTLVAPLDESGRLDPELWRSHNLSCRVVRRHDDSEDEIGQLVRRPGGSWAVRFPGEAGEEDAAPHLGETQFLPGEYMSIADAHDMHTFRIVSVSPL